MNARYLPACRVSTPSKSNAPNGTKEVLDLVIVIDRTLPRGEESFMRGLVARSTDRATSLAKVESDLEVEEACPTTYVLSRTEIISAKTREKDRSYDDDKTK